MFLRVNFEHRNFSEYIRTLSLSLELRNVPKFKVSNLEMFVNTDPKSKVSNLEMLVNTDLEAAVEFTWFKLVATPAHRALVVGNVTWVIIHRGPVVATFQPAPVIPDRVPAALLGVLGRVLGHVLVPGHVQVLATAAIGVLGTTCVRVPSPSRIEAWVILVLAFV